MNTRTSPKHVVIVGGGFAGLACARKLAKSDAVRVTLIDKNNYHQFQPLLYQFATAELGTGDVATSLRQSLHDHPNVDVKMAEVMVADPKTPDGDHADGDTYQGDFLVSRPGRRRTSSTPRERRSTALPLYSLEEAQRLRSRVLAMFEAADRDPSVVKKGALNFVIIGGGPTGTELAGALADMINLSMTREYSDLAVKQRAVYLVDHGPTLLAPFSAEAHEYAARTLQRKGVQLLLGEASTTSDPIASALRRHVDSDAHGGLGRRADGCAARGPCGTAAGRGGRIEVQPDLTVEVSLAFTRSATSPTFQARMAIRFRNSRPLRSNAASGPRTTSWPRSRASPEPPSTITTKASWR